MAAIYKLYFKGTTKFYVGSSYDPQVRFKQHLRELADGKHSNSILNKCYSKYGAPYMEILEECDKTTQLTKEQEAIDILQPELNINPSAIMPPSMKGRTKSEQAILKGITSRKLNGKKRSIESNLAAVATRRERGSYFNSDKQKAAISAKLKQVGMKAILQLDKEGNVIKEYRGVIEAMKLTNNRGIASHLRGASKTSGGYKWKYKD
jgi:group I intron endonuclease